MYQYICLGNLCIPTYGLMMTIGVLLCSFLVLRKAKQTEIIAEEIIIVMSMTPGMALLGAGLLYILVSYSVKELLDNILGGDFAFIKNVGLVFYGGLIGGIIGAFIALRWRKLDVSKVEQCLVPVIPLGHAIGRIGCLLGGCCRGFEYSGPLAVRNLLASAEKTYFPIQAVEAFINLGIFVFLLCYTRKKHSTYHTLFVYLILYSIVRFLLEFFRDDLIRGSFLMFSTSQWISIGLFFVSIVGFYIFRESKNKYLCNSHRSQKNY